MKRTYKKGSMLMELLIYLVAVGAIVAGAFALLSGKKDEATYKNAMDNFLQSFHEGMLKYSVESIKANNNYLDVDTEEAVTFMNSSIIKLDSVANKITPVHPALTGLVFVEVLPAKDASGTDNKRYKAYFDLAKYVESNGWDNTENEQRVKKLESEIARFFRNISPDVVLDGTATAIGSANTDASDNDMNSDGKILIDKVK